MDPLSRTQPSGDPFAGLASSSLDERDAATRICVTQGPAVGPRLLQWQDAPPSNRARRLWAYTGLHLRRGEASVRAPRSFDFSHAGTLGSALDALAARHGVLVAKDLPAEAQRPVTIALTATTLLGALDDACARADCRANQHARGELVATAGADPASPSAYHGPLRVRVMEIRTVRTTDFATTQTSTQMRLKVDWEWPISPLSAIAVKLDDHARAFVATPVGALDNIGVVAEIPVELEAMPSGGLAGTVTATFDGAFDDVRLPVPGTVECHGLVATATASGDGCQLVLETRDPIRIGGDVSGLGLSPMILAIGQDGEEGIPQVHRVRSYGSGPSVAGGGERWGLRNRAGFGTVTELRLRIAAPPIRAAFPFVLPPFELP